VGVCWLFFVLLCFFFFFSVCVFEFPFFEFLHIALFLLREMRVIDMLDTAMKSLTKLGKSPNLSAMSCSKASRLPRGSSSTASSTITQGG